MPTKFIGPISTILGPMPSSLLTSDFDTADMLRMGLKAYWKLEGAIGTTRLDSVNGFDLTDINTVGQAAGVIGNSAYFQLFNLESLSLADNPTFAAGGGGSFTFAGWVRFDAQLTTGGMVSKPSAGGDDYTISHQPLVPETNFRAGDNTGTPVTVSVPGSLDLNDWYFVAAWYDQSAQTINLQINDGTPSSVAFTTTVFDGGGPFFLGRGSNVASTIDGKLDEWGFWCRALSATERTYLYNNRLGYTYPFELSNNGVGAYTNGFSVGFWSEP